MTPSMTIVTPTADASPTFPGRILYIHKPVISAAGIVTRIVNTPHELSASAFTTTIATLAKVQTMMNKVANVVVIPATGLRCTKSTAQLLLFTPVRLVFWAPSIHRAQSQTAARGGTPVVVVTFRLLMFVTTGVQAERLPLSKPSAKIGT